MITLALGWIRLALVVVPLVAAAIGVQRRIVPEASGAFASLVRAVVGLAICLAVLELLGSVGQFRPMVIIAAEAIVGVGVAIATGVVRRRRTVISPPHLSPPPISPEPTGAPERIAVALAAIVVVAWVVISAWIGRRGVLDNDSIRYHGPFVARWLQTHSLTQLNFTSSRLQETFFPANTELLSSIGVAAFGSDWVTPLLNVGWLVLALLGGWTRVDGRRRPFGLLAVAIVAGSPLLLAWQPGSARNDLAAAALALAALSIARRSEWNVGPLAVAGAAAGLALGSKLSVLAPLAVITVGLPLIATRGRRLSTLASWCVPMGATGSFWYVRNWARAGNPLPWYHVDLGPLHLPSPPFAYLDSQGQSIADYAGSAHFWAHTVPGGLTQALGPAWPLFLAMGAVGIVAALRSRRRFPVLVGAAALVAVVADVFTPYSAGGAGGPTLFPTQLRFLTLAAILALLAGVMVIDVSRLRALPALALVVGLVALANVDGYAALVAAAVPVAVLVVVVAARPWPRVSVRRVLTVAGLLALVASVPFSRWYDAHRYEAPEHRAGAAAAYDYFRHVRDTRVAVDSELHSYPLSGDDLSNFVQTVGSTGAHGAFSPAATCPTWQRLIARGRYDYVVTGFAHRTAGRPPREEGWTAQMPNAQLVLRRGTAAIFRLGPRSHAVHCAEVGADGWR
jgi:hypothetical protein